MFWCSRGIATVNINPDSATVKKYNIWGNPISLTTTKNSNFLSLSLSETPFYLEDVGNNIKPLKKALFIESPGFLVAGKNNNLTITVKNPLLRDISGKVVIKAPAGVVVEPDSYSLNLIVNGKEKRNIQVRPPSDLAGKECRFQASFNSPDVGGDEMETVICQVSRPAVPLSLRTDEIIVDGNADDNGWKQIKPLTVNREEQVVVGRPLCYGDKTTINKEKEWYGPDDLSADVYLSYDNKNLYLLAKVKDNDLTVNSRDRSPYTGDGLELFLDGRSEIKQANAQHTPGVCQLCLVPGDKQHPEATWLWIGKSEAANKQWAVRVASKKTADGYIIEAVIPLDKKIFPELLIAKDRTIGFDISVNDADNKAKRKSQMIWRGTKNNYRDASKFGKLIIE